MTSRVDLIIRAREFIQAHGQVPRTEDLSANPGEAAWQLLEQVLDVIAGVTQAAPHGTPRPVPATPLPAQTPPAEGRDGRREA